MQLTAVIRILGLLLIIFSLSMLPPMLVNQIYHTGSLIPFVETFAACNIVGFVLWFFTRHASRDIKNRDGFLIVALAWSVLSVFAALPFIFSNSVDVSFTDAVFESVSGLTTTGVNVFTGLEQLPEAMRYYRQQIELLGGMGIIVLAVAIMPMLGVGGMQLYRAETPGPIKDSKLTPRITETAKTLWYIYISLIALCALSYHFAGMSVFEAICESFSTISTGGFSVHDASFGFYKSATIDLIASFFMAMGAVNFGLHYLFLKNYRLKNYFQDVEFRGFILILLAGILIAGMTLYVHNTYTSLHESFTQAIFAAVSLMSTTGFVSDNFALWPTFVPYLIMFMALIGGCAGSTAGGIKVVRVLLLEKQGRRELMRLLHPNATLPIKLGGNTMPNRVVDAIWAFVSLFLLLFAVMLLLLLATGLDFTSAFGAVAACLTNAGAGIGKVALSFDPVNTFGKWVLIVAMLAGRLEIFTLLVLLSPMFWRK